MTSSHCLKDGASRRQMCKLRKYKNTSNTRIDECMRNFVNFLKKSCGVKVVACCCGHQKYPMTTIARFNNEFVPYVEIVSGMSIPRSRNFYKKDKEGYYYIPEVKQSEGISHPKPEGMGIRNAPFI